MDWRYDVDDDDWAEAFCVDCGDELRPDEPERCEHCQERHEWEEATTRDDRPEDYWPEDGFEGEEDADR